MSSSTPAPSTAKPTASPWIPLAVVVLLAIAATVILRMPPAGAPWSQGYDPLGSWLISTIVASIPVIVLLGALASTKVPAHWSAVLGLSAAMIVAIFAFHMPGRMAAATMVYGAGYGLLPIGWIIINVIFLYNLTVVTGRFEVMQHSLMNVTQDRRLQLLLIAFCFGAFFEGASGFGTPVAVTATILIGLGFRPLEASGLSLIANTAPVAYGALGTPILGLKGVTGISEMVLGAQVGRILPFFSLLVPFWLIVAFVGWSDMFEIWPAIAVAGICFAIPQYLMSNFHGPWLVDIVAAVISMAALITFMKFWKPKRVWRFPGEGENVGHDPNRYTGGEVFRAWLPWIVLSVCVFIWGTPQAKTFLDKLSAPKFAVHGLDKMVLRVPPVVPAPAKEAAVFVLSWLSATGSGIFIASILAGLIMGLSLPKLIRNYGTTLMKVRYSLLTISAMMAIGFLTRYGGLDATMGLAFARTGMLYPFFGTMLGWLGVALTGSDTASNVLFGSLQKISAQQLNLSPTLMCAANSAGGVMGKMIDAQSIVVASTATEWYGHEGKILRYVFFHSIALAALVGIVVTLEAYVYPFTKLVIR
ncbi:L-lactate transporter [Candidatus Koribacter versatilis Ellin345]|uniref:L-lactate permease n=1 Tax=Koribacter versatilis (strain Ellin345) TaxID=204669 RepID=Q1IQX1_KORVE|nr:L-lactate permease [Candidatus Koribacter versatilis]ABF40729.1 L-lactate transporter [Candidatus Koribacter versatilis Ellin345]